MKLREKTLNELGKVICGDETAGIPYRTGVALVRLFNRYGSADHYAVGIPSRINFTQEKLRLLNGTDSMKHLLEDVFNPVEFIEENYDLEKTSSMFNQYLRFDGYQIQSGETQSRVISIAAQTVDFTIDDHNISIVTSDYINIQIDKCRQKLGNSDYDGAITNARSLVEVVLLDIVFKLTNEDKEYDGDLIKLYRQVQKLLNLTPDNPNLDSTLKQVLSGLTSVVTGLSGMRNKLSDAHATRYRASKHHALLAINSAKTLCDFIYDSMDFQKKE